MKKIDYKTVEKQCRMWEAYYQQNNTRGKNEIGFTLCGNQWSDDVIGRRKTENKESLTFNLALKHLKRMKAQNRQIEFSIDITPTSKEWLENVEETNVFRLLLQNGALSTDMTNTFSNCLDKTLEFGYSFLEASFKRQDETTLCLTPWFKLHKDPAVGFWDINAQHPCKIDGRFGGLKTTISKEEALTKFKDLKGNEAWLNEKDNLLINYWYREYKLYSFILLKSGIYRREDMLTASDEVETNLLPEEEGYDPKKLKELIKKDYVSCIYHVIYLNEKCIQKPVKYPTKNIPLPYNFALTVWQKENDIGEQTFPYTYHLRGAQQLHNFVNSQVATQAKKIAGDKWFTTPTNANNKTKQQVWKNINKTDGTIIVDNVESIRREQAAELSQTLLAMGQQTKQELDEIAGSLTDNQNSNRLVVAGVALDKITHNLQMQNVDIIAAQIMFVNACADLYSEMLPELYTEERLISVAKQDGTQDVIVLNQYIPETQTIRNNIKDFSNNFKFTVKGGPTSEMQKENIKDALNAVYAIDPSKLQTTADLYARNMGTNIDAELERRWSAQIPVALIQFGQGEITRDQYDEIQQQQQQQQMQQQIQMMMQSPEMKLAMAEQMKAMAANMNAESKQYDSQTNRIAAEKKAENDAVAQQVDLLVAMNTNDREITAAQAEDARTVVDAQKELAMHSDKMDLEHKKLESQKKQKALKNAST